MLLSVYNSVYYGVSAFFGIIATKVLGRCLSDESFALLAGAVASAQFVYQSFVASTVMMFLSKY